MTNLLSTAAFKEGTLSVYREGIQIQFVKSNPAASSGPVWIPLEEIVRVHFKPGGFASGGHTTIFCRRDNYEVTLNFTLSQSATASQTVAILEKARNLANNPVLMSANGVNGQLELYKDRVRVRRQGTMAVMTQGLKGDKDIQLTSISSIQLKMPGGFTNGYIQFTFVGGQESKAALFQATQDENSVIFNAAQSLPFQQMKDAIEDQRANALQPTLPVSTAPTDLDQLEKLASLRERGIITEDEFQAKKKQILGL